MIKQARECFKLEQISDAVDELKQQLYDAYLSGESVGAVERDAMLGLPEGRFSFVVQDFAQMLGVDLAWARDRDMLERLLGMKIPVSSLEQMNRRMADGVPEFRQQRTSPSIEQEGAIFVASGDGKGIVMRRPRSAAETHTPSILPSATKGPKPGRKTMAIVGTLSSVDRSGRTPEQMLEILFREGPRPRDEPPRPRPCGKHVWAALDDEVVDREGVVHPLQGLPTTFSWVAEEWNQRDPRHHARRESPLGCRRDSGTSPGASGSIL